MAGRAICAWNDAFPSMTHELVLWFILCVVFKSLSRKLRSSDVVRSKLRFKYHQLYGMLALSIFQTHQFAESILQKLIQNGSANEI